MTTKYYNKKLQTPDGVFDSKKEYYRFCELKTLESKGIIRDLKRQVRYELIPAQYASVGKTRKCIERSCDYIADFQYSKDGQIIVEDVKGYKKGGAYAVYSIKRKLMLERYNIKIMEV